jgi:hypothetical protein
MVTPAEYARHAMGRTGAAIRATVLLSILGLGLVGCSGTKEDPPAACDPASRQAQGMASLSPTGGGCPPLVRPTYNSDH